MIKIEKFKLRYMPIIRGLINKNKESINKSFINEFNNSKFIDRYLLSSNFYLFKYEKVCIGYIWVERIYGNEFRILDIFIEANYISFIKIIDIPKLKNKIMIYEGLDNYSNNFIMEKNQFIQIKNVNLMKKKLFNDSYDVKNHKEIYFRRFVLEKDEELRCALQNEIFHNKNRIPLLKSDILFEETQNHYLNDFSIFIYFLKKPIGYAQIIKKAEKYFLVNFGIIESFRGKGFGKELLKYMCYLGEKNNLTELYINVNEENFIGLDLYNNFNFNYVSNVKTWIKDS